jgi:hypothetical protein
MSPDMTTSLRKGDKENEPLRGGSAFYGWSEVFSSPFICPAM